MSRLSRHNQRKQDKLNKEIFFSKNNTIGYKKGHGGSFTDSTTMVKVNHKGVQLNKYKPSGK